MVDKVPFLLPFMASCAISIGIGLYASRRQTVGARAYALVACSQAIWTLGYMLELVSDSLQAKVLWELLQWLNDILYPWAVLLFALQYAQVESEKVRRIRSMLLIFPAIFWILVASNSLHGWIIPDATLIPGEPFSALTYTYTPVIYLAAVYIYALIVAALYVLVAHFFRSHRIYRAQVAVITLAHLVILAGGLLTLGGVTLANQRDHTPLTFAISNLMIAWGLFRFRLLDVVPIARDTVVENMSDAVIVVDEQNRVIDLNAAARAFVDPSQKNVIGLPLSQVFSQWSEMVEQYAAVHETSEEMVASVNGEQRYYALNISPLYDQGKQFRGRVMVVRDITEGKRIEAALRLSEERYRITSEVISDYAYLYDVETDSEWKLEWITGDSYQRLTGYEPDDVAPFRLYHPEDEALARQHVQRTVQGQQTSAEYRIITKGGEERWVYIRRYPLWDTEQKRVVRFYGVAQDITERKRMEQQLAKERTLLQTVIANLPDSVFVKDRQGRIILVNLAHAQFMGADATDALIGKTVYDYFSTELAAHFSAEEGAVMESGQGVYNQEVSDTDPSGQPHWFLKTKVPLRDHQDQVIGLVGIARDITERKQAEQALRVSEERYRIVTEVISDYAFLYAVEPDGSLSLEWITEGSATRVTGYAPGEIDLFRLYHAEDEARAREDVQQTLQGQSTEGEYRIVTKRGEERWVYIRRYPLWDDEQKRVVRFYGVAQDITERKRAEAEEREQRALAEALLDTADALNSTLDVEDVLDRILTNVERVTPHGAGTVMLIDEGVARVVGAKSRTTPDWKAAIQGLSFPLATTPNLLHVYQTRQPRVVSDVKSYPGWVDVPASHWIRSNVTIPIQQEENVIGFLTWESAAPDVFTPKVVSRLQAFAHQIATAITNARLYRQAQELAVLEERQRLARDLHDAVTQTMFSASVIAETLPRLWEQNPRDPQVAQGLTQLQRLTRGAVAEMRSLLMELRPETLEGVGLPRLITQLAEAFSGQTGIIPALDIEGERALPPEVKMTLYRITQEALNNVSKHARASELNLKLTINHMVKLIVTDNGRGFLPEQVKPGSLGLKIMRERAEKIGAQFRIESEPGKSTTVTVEWKG